MGAYDAADASRRDSKKSHRFVHLVHDKDFVDFIGCWSQVACNNSLETKSYDDDDEKNSVTMLDTHVWDVLIASGEVRIAPCVPPPPL